MAITSETFSGSSVPASFTESDPQGDSTFSVSGGLLTGSVPSGTDHDWFQTTQNRALLWQSHGGGDFDVTLKFDASLSFTGSFKVVGIGVTDSSENAYVRATIFSQNAVRRAFFYGYNGTEGEVTQANTVVTFSTIQYIRLIYDSSANEFEMQHSADAATWTSVGTMTYTMSADRVGIAVGNASGGSSPAFSIDIDEWTDNNASSGITGTGAYSLPSFTHAGSGEVLVEGSGSYNLPSFTHAATGEVVSDTVTGTGAYALPSFTHSATGEVLVEGSGSYTFPSFTHAGSGGVLVEGSGSYALPAFTHSASGSVETVIGTGSYALPGFTHSAAGEVLIEGSGAYALPSFVHSAAGDVSGGLITGTGSYALPAFTHSAAGEVLIEGSGAYALPSFTYAGSGVVGGISIIAADPFIVPYENRIYTVRAL